MFQIHHLVSFSFILRILWLSLIEYILFNFTETLGVRQKDSGVFYYERLNGMVHRGTGFFEHAHFIIFNNTLPAS